ncbi:MAG: replication-associated recombination protein A [Saprospiraceae bacterium]
MIPLAERMRPRTLQHVMGQAQLTGPGKVLSDAIRTGYLPSIILWGPPGVGKTTIAHLIGHELARPVFTLSAISAGVREVREVIALAEKSRVDRGATPILFIDEIHRFNKGQQDALLGAVEKGLVTLVGATTENPSFEVNNALLSRAQVYVLNPLDDESLLSITKRIILEDELFSAKAVELKETSALFELSGGDARKLCNIMEMIGHSPGMEIQVTDELVRNLVSQNIAQYDKGGELHYDIISAFIKSVRGSDPNAALYWFARMLQGGEDPNFICRRLVILACEDIGLANPNALLIAQAAQQAVHLIGWPEGRIVLSEAIIYLSSSPKSNSAYLAVENAIAAAAKHPKEPVPLHLRNPVTGLMKKFEYGKNYQYGHQYKGNFIPQQYLPDALREDKYYEPGKNATENKILENLKNWWKDKY